MHPWYEESLERGGAATRFLRIALTDKRQFPYLYDGDVARRRLIFDRGTYHVTLSEFEVAPVRLGGLGLTIGYTRYWLGDRLRSALMIPQFA